MRGRDPSRGRFGERPGSESLGRLGRKWQGDRCRPDGRGVQVRSRWRRRTGRGGLRLVGRKQIALRAGRQRVGRKVERSEISRVAGERRRRQRLGQGCAKRAQELLVPGIAGRRRRRGGRWRGGRKRRLLRQRGRTSRRRQRLGRLWLGGLGLLEQASEIVLLGLRRVWRWREASRRPVEEARGSRRERRLRLLCWMRRGPRRHQERDDKERPHDDQRGDEQDRAVQALDLRRGRSRERIGRHAGPQRRCPKLRLRISRRCSSFFLALPTTRTARSRTRSATRVWPSRW